MDHISLDLGLDMTLDALITRADQLVKLEGNALADRSTHIYNLQRKVNAQNRAHGFLIRQRQMCKVYMSL